MIDGLVDMGQHYLTSFKVSAHDEVYDPGREKASLPRDLVKLAVFITHNDDRASGEDAQMPDFDSMDQSNQQPCNSRVLDK